MGFDNKNSYWIDAFIKQYEESFKKIDLLDRKSEYWRFASPSIWYDNYISNKLPSEKQIASSSFNYDVITDCFIKFKDGVLDINSLREFKKGEKNIEASSYKDAVTNENHWSTQKFGVAQTNAEKPYERPLALFNGLDSRDGVFIKFKKGMRKKFHIIYEGNEQKKSTIRNLFDFEEDVDITIIEHFYGNSKYNIVSEFFSDKNSKFEHIKIVNQDITDTFIYHLFGNCKKYSNVKAINFSLSENPVRNEVNLYLEGPMCNATVASLGFGQKDTSICDNTVFISHQDESSKSRQIIKNALSGGAKAIFQGKIYVSSMAQKTDGYQMSNGLILTDDCEFLVKPELEIYADDVVCSHGSISGTLNEDHLFYLQSRGIPLVVSQKLLIQAFFAEILNEIKDEKLINHIQKQISIKLA
ncbi:MAG: SufB/SufD family protein [Paracoccaceae bacterium]